jgi:acyl carrier protein
MVLFSSTISITGGIGQVDYCAANAFLDAFAVANSLSPKTHTVSINWDAWQWTDWQDSMMALDPQLQSQFNQARERYGIKFHEGVDALSRVLNSSFAQLIVATRDLDAIIRQHRAFTASNLFEEMERARLSRSLHPRPNLGVAYVPPGNELEQSICALWQELLGIEQVGVEDNFFELGGHSLLATQLISRLKKRFYLDIPLRAIYESPTVAEMALVIEELLIDKIEGLPEEGSAPRPAA